MRLFAFGSGWLRNDRNRDIPGAVFPSDGFGGRKKPSAGSIKGQPIAMGPLQHMEKLKKIIILFLIFLALSGGIGGLIYLYTYWEDFYAFCGRFAFQGNIERLKVYILSFGIWAPLISAFFMVFQSVVLFLPAFPIFVVNTLVFGLYWGGLLSWSSAVIGSILCFAIAKGLGRPVVQRLVNRVNLEAADIALKKYEKYVILFFGFMPVISFDVISYAAGLTLLGIWEFIPLACIAQIPSAVFYSFLVHRIDRGVFDVYWVVVVCLFLFLSILTYSVRAYLNRRQRKPVTPAAIDA